MTRLLILVLAIFAAVPAFAQQAAMQNCFRGVEVENGDGEAEIRWSFLRECGEDLGVRLYRVRSGLEMAPNVAPLALVEDVGKDVSVEVGGLENGQQHMFVLEAYGSDGTMRSKALVFTYPGEDGPLPQLENVYAAAGNGAVALFWDPADRRSVVGYEVSRQRRDEKGFTLVKRMTRVHAPEHVGGKPGPRAMRPTLFRDVKVINGEAYRYSVRAFSARGEFGPAAETDWIVPEAGTGIRPEEIVLLYNSGMPESGAVAEYYARKRGIPDRNMVGFWIPKQRHRFNYERHVAAPLREYLLETGRAGKVKVLVPCYGMPLKAGIRSLDSRLTDVFDRFVWGRRMGTRSPYFGRDEHFDPSLGIYLVSRIDGPTPDIARGLVDKALAAEKSVRATDGAAYFVDDEFGRNISGPAAALGVKLVLNDRNYTRENNVPEDTMWCFAWGHPYRNVREGPWPVGSVVSWLKSDTLIRLRPDRGEPYRYWCEGLLADGVTATFGSVVEPYKQGYTRGDLFFERFWSGEYTFAEAVGMATPTVQWAMSAVGDPLFRLRPPENAAARPQQE